MSSCPTLAATLARATLLAGTALSGAMGLSTAAQAQDTPAIVVTAQKFEQLAQDVPITITAVSGDQIRALAVTDLDELSWYVPGLNIQEQSANNPGIVIRGVTSDSGSAQQAPRVTMYYNGVDISRSRGTYQGIFDMERIEVVKGPQATLFGTASAVGAIHLVSAKPRPEFSAEVNASYGNFNAKQLGGFINAGDEKVAARLAFEWRKRDGFVENLSPRQETELYALDNLGLRASVRFTPTEDFTLDIIGTYDRQRNGGTPFISGSLPTADGPANPFGRANLGGSPLSEEVLGAAQLGLERDVYDINISAEYQIDENWSFTTVNGYREFASLEVFDADGSAAWFLEFAELAEGLQLNHEGRFNYAANRLRASFGWNYFMEDGRQNVPFSTEEGTFLQCMGMLGIPRTALPCVAPNGVATAAQATGLATGGRFSQIPYRSVFENQGENHIYSVFADMTFLPTDRLELTAGVRYLWEDRNSGFFAAVPVPVLPNLAPGRPLTRSLIPGQVDTGGQTFMAAGRFDAWLPRFNMLYRVSRDVNVYGTISKGRRSPVVQLNAARTAAGPVPNSLFVPEEVVWNYEGGVKVASGPVLATIGVFLQQYNGFQVAVFQPDGSTRTESAGNASNLGAEAELTVRATSWLTLFANGALIDAKIDEDTALTPAFSGARFRLQPRLQTSGGLTISKGIGNGMRFFATPSVNHRSSIFFEVPNNPLVSQGPVTIANARAGIAFADEKFEIAAFIRNAFDANFLLDGGNTGAAFGIPTFIPAEPRFFGVQFIARAF